MKSISFKKMQNRSEKKNVCDSILHELPEWFSREIIIKKYTREATILPMYCASIDGEVIGFITIKSQNEFSDEVHTIAIKKRYHRKGIGKMLMKLAAGSSERKGKKYLTVKTPSLAVKNNYYDQTRSFYLNNGFVPLNEFSNLWEEKTAGVLMVKAL